VDLDSTGKLLLRDTEPDSQATNGSTEINAFLVFHAVALDEDSSTALLDSLQLMSSMLLMSSAESKYGKAAKIARVIAAAAAGTEVSGDPNELVAESDAARLIPPSGVSVRSMSRYRRAGLIAFFRIKGRIFYRRADLQAFVDSMRTPASRYETSKKSESHLHEKELELWRLLDGEV